MLTGDAQRRVEALMFEFREFVSEIEQERIDLKNKINHLAKIRRAQKQQANFNSATLAPPNTSRTLPASITNNLHIRGPTNAATTTITFTSNSDSSQSATTTDKTESTKPPSYRTAVPQPPARTKRKSATIQIQPSSHNHRHQHHSLHHHNNSASSPQPSSTTTTVKSSDNMSSSIGGRGALIVLEGLDRVGKSTLALKLVQHLERTHRPVAHIRFPDRTTDSGALINKQLKERAASEPMTHNLHLLFSLNRWEQDKKIRDTLNQGVNVIVDRYSYSGIAYSCAYGNLKMSWCCNIETGLPKPDLVIYLELPEQAQIRRPGYGDERFENPNYQRLVRKQYDNIMRISKEEWLRVDVEAKGPDQVLAEIVIPVRDCIESVVNKPIGDLGFALQ